MGPPNGSRLSCGALKKDSFHNLRAPSASSACQTARGLEMVAWEELPLRGASNDERRGFHPLIRAIRILEAEPNLVGREWPEPSYKADWDSPNKRIEPRWRIGQQEALIVTTHCGAKVDSSGGCGDPPNGVRPAFHKRVSGGGAPKCERFC